jgi:hypothetical protein
VQKKYGKCVHLATGGMDKVIDILATTRSNVPSTDSSGYQPAAPNTFLSSGIQGRFSFRELHHETNSFCYGEELRTDRVSYISQPTRRGVRRAKAVRLPVKGSSSPAGIN